MADFDILPQHLHIVVSILKQYLSSDATVWVFGSRVGKASKQYSDLDILIDAGGKPMLADTLIDLKEVLDDSDLPYKVDLVDWNTISDTFKANIRDKRVLLTLDATP